MSHFRTIGVTGRDGNGVAESLQILISFLHDSGLDIVVDENLQSLLHKTPCTFLSTKEIGTYSDLVIVVGGDGSLLGAARMLARRDVPVLGINRGRLGFLTDVLPEEIVDRVSEVLSGQYTIDERFLLDVLLRRDGKIAGEAEALNDVVVNSGTSAQMIEFDLYIEDEFVYHQRSDGLIICTPTGSTAYSLSGGGPIMHPSLDAIGLVPMFPHTLSSRPIVVDGESEIKMVIRDDNRINPPVTCDGQVYLTAQPGDEVFIRKKPHRLKLVHPLNHSFYASCRGKLGWSTKLGI